MLADLTPDELRAVLHRGTIVHAKRGDQLIAAGQTADCLFVVLEGDLDVHREGVRVGGIQQGDIAGESAYLRRRRRSADVVVGSPTATLLKLRAGSLHRAVAQHPDLDSKLQRNLSRALVLRTLADCRSTRQPASLH